jgi:tetratricopeptide (TPR) repeat protein
MPEQALTKYEKALELGAGSAIFLNRLAGLYMQTGAYDQAAASLRKSLGEDPRQLPVYSALGEAFLALGKIDSAVFYVEQARILAPSSSTIYSSLGFLYMQKGQIERARDQLDRALELDKKNPEAHRLYGFYYSQQDSIDRAIAAYQRMGELLPEEVEPFNNMAFLHAGAQRYAEALKYYKMAKERAQDPYLAQAIQGSIDAVRAIVAGKMRARYILVKTKASALEVIDQLATGGDFALLAQQNSIAPNAQDGGDLGFFGPGELMTEFEEAVLQLEVGQLSEIVEVPMGFMIIQRLN